MPTKTKDGRWRVDLRPDGAQGKRVRKLFTTKAEALRFEAHVTAQAGRGEWNPKPADNRKLAELIAAWFSGHGQHLKDGARRLKKLNDLSDRLGNPLGRLLRPEDFTRDRDRRVKAGIAPKTCNNELGYLNAVYNELSRTHAIDYASPLASVRPIRIAERELTWLTDDQVQELLDSIDSGCDNPHVGVIARVCLATGARWGEAEGLQPRHLRNGALHFTDTKSGKNRSVPVAPALFRMVKQHLSEHKAFSSSITSFRRALDRCSYTLPKGQASHVLRHSFASHFMMKGGNILTLQKVLGHSSIVMTMRYAHLAPDHLQEAIALNPLSGHFMDASESLVGSEKEKSL